MIGEYIRVSSAQEGLQELHKEGVKASFLAGGTEIMRLGSTVDCSKVVSLRDLNLDGIFEKNKAVHIGSTVTFQKALENPIIPSYLKEALRYCASRQKRNMATIGGNIALGRDDSYLMATLIAAKARLVLADISKDGLYSEENIPIREYHSFKDHFSGSLILEIVLNKVGRYVVSERFSKTEHGNAAVTLSFGADISNNEIHDVRIAAAVKGSGLLRLQEVEALIGESKKVNKDDLAALATNNIAFVDDISGSASYKKYILGTTVAKFYNDCLQAIEKGGK